jgi:hypothetical protein
MGRYLYRLFGAAVLDGGTYENLESDPNVTRQAWTTILLASLSGGTSLAASYGFAPRTVAFFSAAAVVGWLAWTVLMFQIGTRVLPDRDTHASLGELIRTTGFAAAPGLLLVLAVVSAVATPILAVVAAWMVAAMVVAVRHALDFRSTGRAVAVCLSALALCALVTLVLAAALSTTVR